MYLLCDAHRRAVNPESAKNRKTLNELRAATAQVLLFCVSIERALYLLRIGGRAEICEQVGQEYEAG